MVLMSRSGNIADQATSGHWHSATMLAAVIHVELCDISSRPQASHRMEGIRPRGIIHSAGILADAMLPNQYQVGLRCVWGSLISV